MNSIDTSKKTTRHVQVVSWFELFYDLVIVAAFSQAGKVFIKSPTWSTTTLIAASTALLALMWFMTTLNYGIFRNESAIRRAIVVAEMFCILLATLAVGEYGIPNWIGFLALGIAFLCIALLYWIRNETAPSQEPKIHHNIVVAASLITGLISLTLALIIHSATPSPSDWLIPILIAVLTLIIAIPTFGPYLRSAVRMGSINIPHLKERLGLLVIIVLGEQFVSLVALIGTVGKIPNAVAFLACLIVAYAIWSLYFTDYFDLTPPSSPTSLRVWLGVHALLVFGCVSVAAEFSTFTMTDASDFQHSLGGKWTPLPMIAVIGAICVLAIISKASLTFIRLQIVALLLLCILTAIDVALGDNAPWFASTGAIVLLADALAASWLKRTQRNPTANA